MAEAHEPYLQIEFSAIRNAAHVARAAKAQGHPLTRNDVIGGLLDLWEGCWRTKSASISRLTIIGCFGADIIAALVEFGFLALEGDGFRAKGAGKYLRIAEGRSKGGHAAKNNLVPGPKPKGQPKGEPKGSRRAAEEGAEDKPKEPPSAPFGSSSEQRTANSEQHSPNSKREERVGNFCGAWVTSVWEHHRDVFGGKGNIVPPLDRQLIQARLDDGRTADELMEAVDGLKANDWRVRKGLTKLSQLFESDETVRIAIRWKHHPPDKEPPPPKDVRKGYVYAGEDFDSAEFEAANRSEAGRG